MKVSEAAVDLYLKRLLGGWLVAFLVYEFGALLATLLVLVTVGNPLQGSSSLPGLVEIAGLAGYFIIRITFWMNVQATLVMSLLLSSHRILRGALPAILIAMGVGFGRWILGDLAEGVFEPAWNASVLLKIPGWLAVLCSVAIPALITGWVLHRYHRYLDREHLRPHAEA